MIKVLSIAGSDPSSGAGIQADLKTFQTLGVFGMAVPAAHTVQNSRGVDGVKPAPPGLLQAQLQTLLQDVRPDCIKIGMLLTRSNVAVVAMAVKTHRVRNLVVDPLIHSSSGSMLLESRAVHALKKTLFPAARIVTPNIPEAELLTGLKIRSEMEMDFAAGRLLDMGPHFVLIKGGHRKRGPATDTLYGGKNVLAFSTNRRTGVFHGTGCALSSAIAVFIARGFSVEKAVEKAKLFVDMMLKTAKPVGANRSIRYFQF